MWQKESTRFKVQTKREIPTELARDKWMLNELYVWCHVWRLVSLQQHVLQKWWSCRWTTLFATCNRRSVYSVPWERPHNIFEHTELRFFNHILPTCLGTGDIVWAPSWDKHFPLGVRGGFTKWLTSLRSVSIGCTQTWQFWLFSRVTVSQERIIEVDRPIPVFLGDFTEITFAAVGHIYEKWIPPSWEPPWSFSVKTGLW